MSASTFPTMNFSRYVWGPSLEDPSKYTREGAAGEVMEDLWNRYNHGEQNLFLCVDLNIAVPTSTHDFVARARDAWLETRFNIPIVAASTEQDHVGSTLLTYGVVKDNRSARAWAERTVRLYEGSVDLDKVRFEIGKKRIPEPNGDQTFIYIVSRTPFSFGMLLHTHHTPFDGVGTKILLTKYLKTLALYLEESSLASKRQFEWGKEIENLTPAVYQVLCPSEDRQGTFYNQTLAAVIGGLLGSFPRYGFKQRNIGPGPTRRTYHTFSAEETAKIVRGVRDLGYTVNQIAQASVCLVCVMDNPPSDSTPTDASLFFYGLLNSRSRLAPTYSGRDGYPGYCLGVCAIIVPVAFIKSAAVDGEKAQLIKTAEAIKQEYAKAKTYPSLLAVQAQAGDMLVAAMTASPPPPWMGPSFSGDGIGETYLNPEYTDSQGKPIIEITNSFISLNKTDPGPFFRVHSWNNKLTLAADYNELAMPKDVVDGFIKKWVMLMSLTSSES